MSDGYSSHGWSRLTASTASQASWSGRNPRSSCMRRCSGNRCSALTWTRAPLTRRYKSLTSRARSSSKSSASTSAFYSTASSSRSPERTLVHPNIAHTPIALLILSIRLRQLPYAHVLQRPRPLRHLPDRVPQSLLCRRYHHLQLSPLLLQCPRLLSRRRFPPPLADLRGCAHRYPRRVLRARRLSGVKPQRVTWAPARVVPCVGALHPLHRGRGIALAALLGNGRRVLTRQGDRAVCSESAHGGLEFCISMHNLFVWNQLIVSMSWNPRHTREMSSGVLL